MSTYNSLKSMVSVVPANEPTDERLAYPAIKSPSFFLARGKFFQISAPVLVSRLASMIRNIKPFRPSTKHSLTPWSTIGHKIVSPWLSPPLLVMHLSQQSLLMLNFLRVPGFLQDRRHGKVLRREVRTLSCLRVVVERHAHGTTVVPVVLPDHLL